MANKLPLVCTMAALSRLEREYLYVSKSNAHKRILSRALIAGAINIHRASIQIRMVMVVVVVTVMALL